MKINKYIVALVPVFFALSGIFYFFTLKDAPCGPIFKDVQHNVIVTAFEIELQPFLDTAKEIEVCSEDFITYHLMQKGDIEFVLFQSGIGLENARSNTYKALSTLSVNSLILSGIAGSVHADFEIGHTVVAGEWLNLETEEMVAVDEILLEKAGDMDTVEIVLLGATSPTFVRDTNNLPKSVSLVDMETFEIARVAKEKKVPFIAFRSISDRADGRENEVDFTYAAGQSAERVLEFLKKLK